MEENREEIRKRSLRKKAPILTTLHYWLIAVH